MIEFVEEGSGERRVRADEGKRLFWAMLERSYAVAGEDGSVTDKLEVKQLDSWVTVGVNVLKPLDYSWRKFTPAAQITVDAATLEDALAQAMPVLRAEVDQQWEVFWRRVQEGLMRGSDDNIRCKPWNANRQRAA
jgi:hypothetical protein